MNVGFTASCRCDDFRFQLHDAEVNAFGRASLVSVARDEARKSVALVLGQLFYRNDLARRLPQGTVGREVSDAELALAVYVQRGAAGLEELEGEFAVVFWDGAERRLLALRDPFGAWPLFWTSHDGGVTISSRLRTLAQTLPAHDLDLEFLAEFLVTPFGRAELPTERTAFQGIQRVRPGTVVAFGLGGRVETRRYWDWSSRIEPGSALRREEAGERLAELLRTAVRERVQRGPVAAQLSGGMDSTAVACLARDLMAAGDAAGPLHTLSLVYDRPSLAGERAYIEEALRQGGPVEPHLIQGEAAADYEWFQKGVPAHDEPFTGLRCLETFRVFVEAADRLGAATTMTGLGADEILECAPDHIADLLRTGRWLSAWRETCRWAQAWNRGAWSVLAPYGLLPLAPALVCRGPWGLVRGRSTNLADLAWTSVPWWIRPTFAKQHGLAARGTAVVRRLYGKPTTRSLQLFSLEATAGDWARWYLAGPNGMNITHPFRDPRVVAFTLGLPLDIKATPGQRKPLLQAATRGILPEAIRTRRQKRGFDDIYGLGLGRNLTSLERLVRASPLQDMGILDHEQLIGGMRQAAAGIGDAHAREHIDRALGLIGWLGQRQKTSPASHSLTSVA